MRHKWITTSPRMIQIECPLNDDVQRSRDGPRRDHVNMRLHSDNLDLLYIEDGH